MREIIRKDPNEYWTNVLFQERKCNSIFIAFHGYNLSRGQFSCIHFDCRLVWWFIMANSELWRLTHLFRRLFVWVCVYILINWMSKYQIMSDSMPSNQRNDNRFVVHEANNSKHLYSIGLIPSPPFCSQILRTSLGQEQGYTRKKRQTPHWISIISPWYVV